MPHNEEEILFKKLIKKLGKDTLNYLPAVLISALLGLVSVTIFTRIFVPEAYGQYSLVLATTTTITSLLSLWLQQGILRYLPEFKKNKKLKQFTNSLAPILFVIIFFFVFLALLLFPFLKANLNKYSRFYFWAILLVSSDIIFRNLVTVLQANMQSKSYAKYKIIGAIAKLAFSLILIFLIIKDVVSIIIGTSASFIILSIFLIKELGLFKHCKDLISSFDFKLVKRIVLYGFPLAGWLMGSTILSISDRFIIEIFKGSLQVGIYASNYSLISRALGLVAGPILMAVHPILMNTWETKDRDRIREIIATFSRYFLLLAIPVVFFLSIFSLEIVSILLGEGYREGHKIIPFILMGFLVWNFSMYGHKGLELLKKTKIMFFLVIICALLNIMLNLIFVPIFGYLGAAITTLLSYLLYPIMVYFSTKRYLKWKIPWRSIINTFISAILMGGLLIIFKLALANRLNNIMLLTIAGIIAFPVYFISLKILRELRGFEIRFLRRKIVKLLSIFELK